jgi:hypothetical protein
MLFTNKNDFKNTSEVYRILTALEVAHAKQDGFSASILLTQLEQKNIKIIADNACNLPADEYNDYSETTEEITWKTELN